MGALGGIWGTRCCDTGRSPEDGADHLASAAAGAPGVEVPRVALAFLVLDDEAEDGVLGAPGGGGAGGASGCSLYFSEGETVTGAAGGGGGAGGCGGYSGTKGFPGGISIAVFLSGSPGFAVRDCLFASAPGGHGGDGGAGGRGSRGGRGGWGGISVGTSQYWPYELGQNGGDGGPGQDGGDGGPGAGGSSYGVFCHESTIAFEGDNQITAGSAGQAGLGGNDGESQPLADDGSCGW